MRGYGTNTLDVPTYLHGAGTAQPAMLGTQPRLCVGGPDARPHPAPRHALPPTLVPNWNHPYVLERMQALLQAVAAALGDTSDLAWIDVGLYGQYGEWAHEHQQRGLHTGPGNPRHRPRPPAPPSAALRRCISRVFPDAQHAMFIPLLPTWTRCSTRSSSRAPPRCRWACAGTAWRRTGFMKQWTDRPSRLGTDLRTAGRPPPGSRSSAPSAPAASQDQRRHRAAAGARLPCLHRGQWQPERAVVQLLRAPNRPTWPPWGARRATALRWGPSAVTAPYRPARCRCRCAWTTRVTHRSTRPWQLQAQLRDGSRARWWTSRELLSTAQARAILPGVPAQINTAHGPCRACTCGRATRCTWPGCASPRWRGCRRRCAGTWRASRPTAAPGWRR